MLRFLGDIVSKVASTSVFVEPGLIMMLPCFTWYCRDSFLYFKARLYAAYFSALGMLFSY